MFLKCDYCEFTASSCQCLTYHIVIMHDNTAWACKYCDYLSKKKNKVIRHSKVRHLDEMTSPDDDQDDYFNDIVVGAAQPDHLLCYFKQESENKYVCLFCNECVQQKDEFSNHLRSQHLPSQFMLEKLNKDHTKDYLILEDSFECVCKLCQSRCSDVHLLADHIFASHPINIFSDKFSFNFESTENLIVSKYKCTECLYNTFVLDNFQKHTQKHSSNFNLKCGLCSFSSDYEVILKKHNSYWHMGKKNYSKTNLKKDSDIELLESELISPLQCVICRDKIYKSEKTLKIHMKIKHPGLVEENEDSVETWEISSQSSSSKEVLNMTEQSVFRCEFCHLDFNMFDSLFSHCSNFHNKDVMNLNCDQCAFMTNQVSILTSHIATHNQPPKLKECELPLNEKIYKCSECGKSLKGWSVYMVHKKQHNKKGQGGSFKCPHCPFKTSANNYLTQHLVIHNAYRDNTFKARNRKYYRHICEECPYRAKDSTNYANHLKNHKKSNAKYTCKYCTYSSDNMSFLKKHSVVHTEEYAARFSVDLNNAVQSFHQIQETFDCEMEGEVRGMDAKMEEVVEEAIEKSKLVASKMPNQIEDGSLKDEEMIKFNGDLENGKLLHCEECPFMTEGVEDFINHTSLHFHRRMFQCRYCDYSVPSYAYLLVHLNLHSQPNNNLLYNQSLNNLKYLPTKDAEESVVDNHFYSKMFEFSEDFTLEPLKLLNCNMCPFSTPHRTSFLKHLQSHNNQLPHKCPLCSFTEESKAKIASHIAVHFIIPGSSLSSQFEVDSEKYKNKFLSDILKKFGLEEDKVENDIERNDEVHIKEEWPKILK